MDGVLLEVLPVALLAPSWLLTVGATGYAFCIGLFVGRDDKGQNLRVVLICAQALV